MTDVLNTYVQTLHAEHNKALHEQRAVTARAVDEKRELTAEERVVVERTDQAMDRLSTEIDQWLERSRKQRESDEALGKLAEVARPDQRASDARVEESEERALESFLRGRGRGNATDERGRPAFEIDLKPAIRALHAHRAGYDRDEYRALSIVTAAAGGTLVPTSFSTTLLMAMETITGPIEAGAEILDTANGESFVYFTEATAGTAAVVGEGSALAGSDPTFGRVSLGAYKYAELVTVSNELISDSGIDIVSYVARTAGKALGRVTNTAFTTGSGSNAPQGFVVGAGNGGTAQTVATGVPSYDNLVDLIYNVGDEAYAGSSARFMTRFANLAALRKVKDTAGNYIWEPSLAAGQPSTLLGYGIVTNPNMRAWATAAGTGTIAFGDFFEGYVIRRVGAVRFESSADYAFNTDQMTYRAVMRVDGKVKQAGAIRALREPTT